MTLLREFDLNVDGLRVTVPMASQRVVAFLALHDRAVLRSHVAASLWLDVADARAQASLRSALWRLGRGSHPIVQVSNGTLQLDDSVAIDLRDSIATAKRALSTSARWEPGDAVVSSLSGDLLPNWYEDWVLIERERFRQLRMHALEAVCSRLTTLESFGLAIEAGIAAVSAEPLRESAHRALIRAYIAEGNIGEARREYEVFRRLLQRELDLEPSGAMKDLIRSLEG